jgi:hypothetical protein
LSAGPVFAITDAVPVLPSFTIVDVGPAHPGTPQRWQGLLDAGAARVIGLEAFEPTCSAYAAHGSPRHTYLPLAIADGTERTFHVTANPGYSALYEPNRAFVQLVQGTDRNFDVVRAERIRTWRLDDVAAVRAQPIDCMCFDIPGAALEALTHGSQVLQTTMVVQIRILYGPMYRGQPMLGEVDTLLRRLGFLVHRLLNTGAATLEHAAIRSPHEPQLNQDIWADYVYVRDFTDAATQPADSWIRLGVLVHELYGSHDLAHLAFAHADRRSGSALAARYLASYQAATS